LKGKKRLLYFLEGLECPKPRSRYCSRLHHLSNHLWL